MKLNLGNQIRSHRHRLNLTQEQLAEQFGTSPQAISRWENGSAYPDIETLPMIASFFGTTIDALLGSSDEEKERFCADLQSALFNAIKSRSAEKTVENLRKIRRNLRDYHHGYQLWGIFSELRKARFYEDERILDEIRLLSDAVFTVYPRTEHFAVIENMAYMENDERIDAFLDDYASRENLSRPRLLLNRFKMREELDKIEPLRQFNLWYELEHIVTAVNDWREYLSNDPGHLKWICETQLRYLNEANRLSPDERHFVSGGTPFDLWCHARITLGLLYARALSRLGENGAALDAFGDVVSIVERAMHFPNEEFTVNCSSPALNGFSLKAKYRWEEAGKILELESNGWFNWIIPETILKEIENDPWYGTLTIHDERFEPLVNRLQRCVIKPEEPC